MSDKVSLLEGQRIVKQNHKILRFRAALAQLAIVCVNLKSLNSELLSISFCESFKSKLCQLNSIRDAVQVELKRQLTCNLAHSSKRPSISFFGKSSFAINNNKKLSLRLKLLSTIHHFCDNMLSELHLLNYEHISDKLHTVLGELIDLYVLFRCEIVKERDLQSQRKASKFLAKVS